MKVLPPVTDEDQMLCGLAYPLWPIAPFFILKSVKRDDPFICFHAYQGLAFGGFSTAGFFILFAILMVMFRILPGSSTLVPGVLGIGVFLGGWAAFLAIICLSLFLGWRASAGEMLKLPLIGEWAEERMIASTGMSRDEFIRTLQEPAPAVTTPAPDPGAWPTGPPDSDMPVDAWEAQQQYSQARQQHAPAAPTPQPPPRPAPQPQNAPSAQPQAPSWQQAPAQPGPPQRPVPQARPQPGISRPVWPKVASSPAPSAPAQVPPQRPDPASVRAQAMRAAPPQPAERPLGQENNILRQWLASVDDD